MRASQRQQSAWNMADGTNMQRFTLGLHVSRDPRISLQIKYKVEARAVYLS
jgi:hypothetical protein